MDEKKERKEIELTNHRAILSIPTSAIAIDITCKLLDENKELYDVIRTMDSDEVWDAFRRCDEGYIVIEEDRPHAVALNPGDGLALIYIPEDAVFAHLECICIGEKISRTFSMVDLRRAFKFADDDYIDEDDRFVLTEKGKKLVEELRNDEVHNLR